MKITEAGEIFFDGFDFRFAVSGGVIKLDLFFCAGT